MKKEKGITLIALVVTIIVLLILAGVTINMVLGNNGIITKATEAKNVTEKSNIVEAIQLGVLSAKLEDASTATDVRAKLKEAKLLKDDGITIQTKEIIGREEDDYFLSADGTIWYQSEKIGEANSATVNNTIKVNATGSFIDAQVECGVCEGNVQAIKISENNELEESGQYRLKLTCDYIRIDGKKFSHWEDRYGNIVNQGYNYDLGGNNIIVKGIDEATNRVTSYVRPYVNNIYTPIYIEKQEIVEVKNVISQYVANEEANNQAKILMSATCKPDSQITSKGILYTANKEKSKNMTLQNTDGIRVIDVNGQDMPPIGNIGISIKQGIQGIKRLERNLVEANYIYRLTNVKGKVTNIYYRAYITYVENGVEKTEYADRVQNLIIPR